MKILQWKMKILQWKMKILQWKMKILRLKMKILRLKMKILRLKNDDLCCATRAFTPINLMQYTITIDELVQGEDSSADTTAWNPQLWLVTFGAAAAHVYSFKKGGAHTYDTHMAKLAAEMQERIMQAAEKANLQEQASMSGAICIEIDELCI